MHGNPQASSAPGRRQRALALLPAPLHAQHARAHAGDIHPAFGDGGIVILPGSRVEAAFDTSGRGRHPVGTATDAQGRIVIAGICFNGNSTAGGEDVPLMLVARLQADVGDPIFQDSFDP